MTGGVLGRMADYEFTLPWPPSVNQWKIPFRNRIILTKKGREYRQTAIDRMNELGLSNEALGGRLSVVLTLHPPTARKYDIDNFCKSPFDALTHAQFWVDDEQVDRLLINKGEKIRGGLIHFKVNLLD